MSYSQLLATKGKLTDAKQCLNIPHVVAICGSTRFMQDMADADRELTWAGNIVVKPCRDMKTPHPLWVDRPRPRQARLDWTICTGRRSGSRTRCSL
ncbi:hypothetical protein SNOUR_05710 [Streptomyces noursei ATCC 11455]|nr:hypothetical protein SNOUR_05710 [Streptomyces noursei ATCC 11455]